MHAPFGRRTGSPRGGRRRLRDGWRRHRLLRGRWRWRSRAGSWSRCWCRCRHRLGGRRRRRRNGGHGRRFWSGRRRGCRGRGYGPRRKQRQRVDVRLAVGESYPEMHIRDVVLGLARRTSLGDRGALLHDRTAPHEQRAEMREGHLVAGRGRNGHRRAMCRYRAREGDLSGGGSADNGGSGERDVDSPMLAACVRVVAERIAAQHWAVRRPGPGERVRGRKEEPADGTHDCQCEFRCPDGEHRCESSGRCPVRQRS
jgi:hypothetical protein